MTTVSAPDNPKAQQADSFDPDEYRMTIGEHLEELRMRLIFGMSGFIIAAIACLAMGEKVVEFFLRPLMLALVANKLPPVVHYTEPAESFMVYIKASLITAGAISAPWVLYQLWQFVAAGLYPRERKYITKYLPLSIGLLIGGMVFLYMFVLPIMLEFFLSFTIGKPFHFTPTAHALVVPSTTQPAVVVPTITGDPTNVVDGQIWIDASEHRMKMFFDGDIRSFPLLSNALATPTITLGTYIDLVVQMLLSFGIAFQLPLVVLALVRIGIFDVPQLKKMRRMVYFVMSVLAAFIVPDVVTGMIALVIPMVLLFELGLWLARNKPADDDVATT